MRYTDKQRQNLWTVIDELNNSPRSDLDNAFLDQVTEVLEESNGLSHLERINKIIDFTPKGLSKTIHQELRSILTILYYEKRSEMC